MEHETFVDKVKKHFGYLENEYGFHIIFAINSAIRPKTDGIVKYASDSTLILIDSETGQAAIRFVRAQDDERYYLDPVFIHEYLNTNEKEKQLLLSKNIKDKESASALFNKASLLLSPSWKSGRNDVYSDLEKRLKNYANWLKENANLCLLGDFSRWPEFYEYKINRLVANEIRGGGKEVVLAAVKDETGAIKTIERPIFQRERDFLLKLRKEIQSN